MALLRKQLIEAIHDAPKRVVVSSSGGGSLAISDLLQVPGASRTVLAATVPYCERAMTAWLGCRPEQFCSSRTARAMAMVAWQRAVDLDGNERETAGIACTAGLATDRVKQGSHRAHVAVQDLQQTRFWSVELCKGDRSREEEERLVADLVLNAVAAGCGMEDRLEIPLLEGEHAEEFHSGSEPTWQMLALGRVDHVPPACAPMASSAIFPGAFNPLHVGHIRMAEIGQEILGLPVGFEISIVNVDKPALDYYEIRRRLAQFPPGVPVWLTRAATFEEKTKLFSAATFLVGTDTLRRIAQPRYYGGDPNACEAAIQRIADRGCRFLVFGREIGSSFMRLNDLDLPPVLSGLCREVPPDVFRENISSTSLRRSGAWQ